MASATALRASIASGSADAECLAAHFVVCGLAPGLLEPNSFGDSSRVDASHEVITDIAIVSASRGELIPPGYEPVLTAGGGARSAPAIGSIATIGGTQSTQLQIAVRRQALNACGCGSSETPITALQVIYADRNEKPDAGYEALRRPDGGESACFSGGSRGREAVICASRSLSSESAVPLVDIAVVHCDRHARDVRLPAGYELLPRSLTSGSAGAAVFVAFRRALPVGLLNTPLRPAMLDHISASDRPRVEARRCRPGSTAANCAVARLHQARCGSIQTHRAPTTRNGVGLEPRAVVDIDNLHLLPFTNVGLLHQLRVEGDGTYVMEVGVTNASAVDL